jgi:hypothetical protein
MSILLPVIYTRIPVNFVLNDLQPLNINDQDKEDELGRACSTNGGEEECI